MSTKPKKKNAKAPSRISIEAPIPAVTESTSSHGDSSALSKEAVDRIITHTRLKVTDAQRERAYNLLCRSRFLRIFYSDIVAPYAQCVTPASNGALAYTAENISIARKTLTSLDETSELDARYAYEYARSTLGEDYTFSWNILIDTLRHFEITLSLASTQHEPCVSGRKKEVPEKAWIRMFLHESYELIYGKQPSIHTRQNNGLVLDSPFLRFVEQATSELSIVIPNFVAPLSREAIRKHFQRLKTKSRQSR